MPEFYKPSLGEKKSRIQTNAAFLLEQITRCAESFLDPNDAESDVARLEEFRERADGFWSRITRGRYPGAAGGDLLGRYAFARRFAGLDIHNCARVDALAACPFGDVTEDVVKSKRVRLIRPDRRGDAAVVVHVRIDDAPRRQRVDPTGPAERRDIGARRIGEILVRGVVRLERVLVGERAPFGVGWKPILVAGLFREPLAKLFRFSVSNARDRLILTRQEPASLAGAELDEVAVFDPGVESRVEELVLLVRDLKFSDADTGAR